MTLDMKKKLRTQDHYLNIRVSEKFIKQLNYLCYRTCPPRSKSDVIRKLIDDEYWWALKVDFTNE